MNISMNRSFRGLTGTAAVLAAALGLNLVGPHRAYAAPRPLAAPGAGDLGITILSPDPHVPLAGLKPVEISAFYQGSPTNQIIAIELFIDGAKAATKTLDAPETRGVVSFLVDAGQISAGTHQVVVRATAADQEVQSAKSLFTFNGMEDNAVPLSSPNYSLPSNPSSPALSSGLPPTLRLISPAPDGRVQGVITLRVQATDPSGKAPYVSLFIDKTFKTLRNYAPYEFEWDTTAYSNGYHTIEAYGYNDSPNVGHAKPMRLYVNNPGGETAIRHDLLDAAPPAKPARISALPKKQMMRPLPLRRPALSSRRQAAPLPEAQMASLMTSRSHSTGEIIQQLVSSMGHLYFGKLDFAAELSTPFAAEKPLPVPAKLPAAKIGAARPARLQSFKPLPAAVSRARNTDLAANADLAAMAETPARTRAGRMARLLQIASLRLPENDLASPFVVMPHVAPMSAPTIKIASYRAEMQLSRRMAVRSVVREPLKTHTLRVHLPLGMNALLRSVGQKTVLFNYTTVAMDRPLVAQNRIVFGPLRQIFEQGGGTLTWQSKTGTVRAKSATKDILLTLGNSHAQVNAKQVSLDGKPYLLMGRTMVPVSFLAVALDATVQFDAATGHLLVTSRN